MKKIKKKVGFAAIQFNSVQSLSHVQPFATPWIAARQASLFAALGDYKVNVRVDKGKKYLLRLWHENFPSFYVNEISIP